MNALLLLIAQLSISHQSNQVALNWTGDWILQKADAIGSPWRVATNGVQSYQADAIGTGFFRLASSAEWEMTASPVLAPPVNAGTTNYYVITQGSNIAPSMVLLSVKAAEPFPFNPIFRIWGGQARLHPHSFSAGGSLQTWESRGVYDVNQRAYCITVEVQDRITTPLIIRVLGQDVNGVDYRGYAQFINP